MTPMAHQKVAGPIRPFKWPSGLWGRGGGGSVHRRPEIAYATSSAVAASAASSFSYGRRSQRRPSLLVARWSLAAPSSRVRCQNKKTQHDPHTHTHTHTPIYPPCPLPPPLSIHCMYYSKYMQNAALVCVDEFAALGGLRSILRRLLRLRLRLRRSRRHRR